MKRTLTIDTTISGTVEIALEEGGKRYAAKSSSHIAKAQAVLPLIEALCASRGIDIADIGGIEVKHGPGSFTGIRVGFAIANALGTLLGIPVNNSAQGLAFPSYE